MLKVICEDKVIKNFPIKKVAKAVYKRLNQRERLFVEVSFVDEKEIKRLNKEFRNTDKITDVLSFPYLDGIKGKEVRRKDFLDDYDYNLKGVVIGSVCICLKRAEEQAEEYGHSVKREVSYLALHGFLHLFGYDHIEKADEEEMTNLAREIIESVGIKR